MGDPEKAYHYAARHLQISKETGDRMGQATAQVYNTTSLVLSGSVADPVSGIMCFFLPLDPGSQTHISESLVTIILVEILQFFVNWGSHFFVPFQ